MTQSQPPAPSHSAALGAPLTDWVAPPFPGRSTLVGRLCRVEPLDPARHSDQLFEANAADPSGNGWTYLPYGPFDDSAAYRAWLEGCSAARDPQFYAFIDQATDRAVGLGSYLRIDPAGGSIEVGHLHFSALLRGRPAATEAMALMMQRAFALGYRRYEWKCNALNDASRRAAQRLGFSYEGVFRQATVAKGRNRDTAWYAVIDAEWPALKAAFERWLDPANFDADGRQRLALSDLTRPLLVSIG